MWLTHILPAVLLQLDQMVAEGITPAVTEAASRVAERIIET